MITIVDEKITTAPTKIKIGTTFTGHIAPYDDTLFLAAFALHPNHNCYIVSLNNPMRVWTDIPVITNYKEVNLKIEVI